MQTQTPTRYRQPSGVRKIPASPLQILTRGIAVGFVATQALDIVSLFFYENMTDADRLQEDRARKGHQAYEVMATKIARGLGLKLSEEEIKYWGWKVHRSFGISGGIQYMAAREKFPAIGAGFGIPYGIGFFVAADEIMTTLTGAVPGPKSFSWKAHVRGAIAHIVYGVAMEMTARTFDKVAEYEAGEGWARAEDEGNPSLQ